MAPTNPEEKPDETPAPKLTKAPAVLKFVEAAYPPEELAAGISAEVGLLVDIDAVGRVSKVEVVRSAAAAAFNAAAVEALKQFEFSPAEMDGLPAPVRIDYVYHFEARPPPVQPEIPPVEQPVNLKGWVRERGTRDPVAGASVFLPDLNLLSETGPEGQFELRGVEIGSVAVEVTEIKHKKYTAEVEIKDGEVAELTVYLWKKIDSGFEVTVRGEREKHEVVRRTLQQEELRSVPGTFGDPLRVIENMPGMARVPYGLGILLVRGSQPGDTGVLLDGVPIPLLYHFVGGPSVISPSLISRIDFFPGAYSAKYGRAIAGIVDVSTREPEPKRPHGNASIDLLNAAFYFETPIFNGEKYGTLALAARRSYIDLFLPLILNATRRTGESSVVATPYYWDYQVRYDVNIGRDHLTVSTFGSSDSLDATRSGDAETQAFSIGTAQGFHLGRIAWSRKTDSGLSLTLAPSFGATISSFHRDQESSGETTAWNLGLRGSVGGEFQKGLTLEGGIDSNVSFYNTKLETVQLPDPGETQSPPPLVRNQKVRVAAYGVYVESVWAPFEKWKLIPGLRLDLYDLPKGLVASIEPRVATRLELTDRITAKVAWGLFRQAPTPGELDPNAGNPNLELAQSQQTVAGCEIKITPKLLLDLQGFYNWRNHLVVRSNAYIIRDGQTLAERLNNSGHGNAYGMELLLKHDLTEHFYGWIAYTLSRSEQYDENKGSYLPVAFDQSHILTIVASYKYEGWEFGTRFRLTSGRPEAKILGATFDADSGHYMPLTGNSEYNRGATFHQLDLRVEKTWTFTLWKFSLYLDVQNIYNAENPEAILWDYRYRKSAPLRGLPILPTLGVTGAF